MALRDRVGDLVYGHFTERKRGAAMFYLSSLEKHLFIRETIPPEGDGQAIETGRY